MLQPLRDEESWKRMVLRSMPPPAWLEDAAPESDIVLSSRARLMRNLRGHRFVHRSSEAENMAVMNQVLAAALPLELEANRGLTNAERDHLVGCRLVSPDFEWTLPGRALLIDPDRRRSLMVNEEDHLRVQALSAGWSIREADRSVSRLVTRLEERLEVSWHSDYGYLAASPYNTGAGRRLSAMFHLIGLGHRRRLPAVMKALTSQGIVVRGLFGETSRAIGAFAQVSVTNRTESEFQAVGEYLIREERAARAEIEPGLLEELAFRHREIAASPGRRSLADALRTLAYLRWAGAAGLSGFREARAIDRLLIALEIRTTLPEDLASDHRAQTLRAAVV